MSTFLRYLLFQIPGLVVAAAVLVLLWEVELLSGRVAALLLLLWFLKDLAVYPLVRRAYEARPQDHAAVALVGERGVVVRGLQPHGYVRVRGELWKAEGDDGLGPGDQVEVVAATAMRLTVRRVEATTPL